MLAAVQGGMWKYTVGLVSKLEDNLLSMSDRLQNAVSAARMRHRAQVHSPDRQLDLVREMAAYIYPRPGFTPHRLTIRAAAQVIHLVEGAGHFRDSPPS